MNRKELLELKASLEIELKEIEKKDAKKKKISRKQESIENYLDEIDFALERILE